MRLIAIIFAALALAGCAHTAHKAPTPPVSKSTSLTGYAVELRGAVQNKMPPAETFAGKRCVLQIKMQRDGVINDVNEQGGDPALCEAALNAIKVAEIPAPPTDAIYDKVKNARLDFAL